MSFPFLSLAQTG